MKRIFAALFLVCIISSYSVAEPIKASGTVAVYFSPQGGCTEAIAKEINAAHKEIRIQAYSFTSIPIAKALMEAHKRGINIEVLLDKSQRSERYTSATFMKNVGIPVYIDDAHAIAHNKVIIIDRGILITGSFNFTKAAEMKNAENLLVFRGNSKLVDSYLRNYVEHKNHSVLYR